MPTVPWEEPILASINAPNTAMNRYILDAWQQAEGGLSVEHSNNPFNTTLDSAKYPHVGNTSVPIYPSIGIGLQNTVRTLKDPAYSHLVKDLQISASPQQFFQDLAASPWAGGHYQGNTLVQHLIAGQRPPVSGSSGTGSPTFTTSAGGETGGIIPVTATNPFSGWFSFVTSWRFAEIVGGILLLVVGLLVVARSLGAGVPSAFIPPAAAKATESTERTQRIFSDEVGPTETAHAAAQPTSREVQTKTVSHTLPADQPTPRRASTASQGGFPAGY